MRRRYQSWLVPYVEGTLDPRRRGQLEARLARDPALAAEAEGLRHAARRLRTAAQEQRPAEAVPAGTADSSALWPGIRERLRPAPRISPGQWAWAGGLCAVATLAWAVTLGPLTSHRTPGTNHTSPQAVAVVPTPVPVKVGVATVGKPHPNHTPRVGGRGTKRPTQGKPHFVPIADESRPDERLATNPASGPDGDVSPDTAPATVKTAEGAPGHLQLATTVRAMPHEEHGPNDAGTRPSNDSPEDRKTDKPASADFNGDVTGDKGKSDAPAERGHEPDNAPGSGHQKRRHRRHRRHTVPNPSAPTHTPTVLPPDTPPIVNTTPKPKVSRPGYID